MLMHLSCLVTGLLLLWQTNTVWAEVLQPYSSKAVTQAQHEGKVVLLEFYAGWCATCKQQQAALKEVLNEQDFQRVVSFQVDFDDAEELKSALNVRSQSTLILFRGHQEVDRSLGETDASRLRDFLRKAQSNS